MAATNPLYTWKDDKQKQADLTNNGTAGTTVMDTATQPRTSFSDSLNPSIAPQPKPVDQSRSFGSMIADIPERQTAVQSAYKTTAEQIQGQQGPEANLARNQFLKGQQEALRDIKETSTLAGRADTGQIRGDVAKFYTKQAMPARQDFEAMLAANAAAQRSQGVQNLVQLEDLYQRGQISEAELELAKQDLGLRRQELAQQAGQFQDEQAFKRYALERGYQEEDINRAWQSGQNELNRELDRYMFDKGYDLDLQQMGEQIRQFDSRLAFDEWATEMNLDENEKNRLHDLRVQEIQNKFSRGERLESQDWSYMMETVKIAAVEKEQWLQHTLNLDTMAKQNQYQIGLIGLQETYAAAARQEGFNHDMALAEYQAGIQETLTKMGIDADTARQAAQIEAERVNLNRELELQEKLAMAQMAQEDAQFAQELGLRADELELTRTQIMDSLITAGIQRDVLQNEIVMSNIDTAAMLFEMADDNQDMITMAAQHLFGTIGSQFEMTPEQIEAGVEAMTGAGEPITPGTATTAQHAVDIANKTGMPNLSIEAIRGFTPDEIQNILDDPADLMNAGVIMKPSDRFENPKDYVGKLRIVGDKLYYIEDMGDFKTADGTTMTNQLKVVDLKTGQTGYWST